MIDVGEVFLAKAEESLEGAGSEYANARYNNCANRCYYAAFQAAICAIVRAGIRPSGEGQWKHAFVQAQFVGALINRRKIYGAALRTTLLDNLILRQRGDYEDRQVSEVQASRAVRRTRAFLSAVR